MSLPVAGSLTVNGSATTINQEVTNISQLMFTAAASSTSFSYKIVDSADLLSDATYTATFTVTDPTATAITVSFKRPADWGTTPVYLWAWNNGGNLFASWPGVPMTEGSNGWFSYTFDKSVTSVNVIFSKNGSPQSVDITGVTQTTCYEYDGTSGTKFTVKTSACESTAVKNIASVQQISIYPQPVKSHFMVTLPNTGNAGDYKLSLYDMSGKAVKTESFTGQTAVIGCEDLGRGVYMVRIMCHDGREVYGGKVVK